MRLTLISPRGVKMGSDACDGFTKQLYDRLEGIDGLRELMSCPNSPLLTVAAIADKYVDEIEYIDEEVEEIDWENAFEIVGMSFMTQQASRAFQLAKRFREMGVYLIAGGMHPTNSPEETGRYFDTVFIGEGEVTIPQFFKDFKLGRPCKEYRNEWTIPMSEVPIPRYDLLNFSDYMTFPIQISRGCPHDCEFCASTKVYGPKYRHKSVDQVMSEIDIICAHVTCPHIYFTDDNMLVDESFAVELLSALKEKNIRWMTHTDISVAERDNILDMLNESGCRKLVIGFESIEPESLKRLEVWKYKQLRNYGAYIEKIQSRGVGVWGTFIVGLDDDDLTIFDRVISFVTEHHLYGVMLSVPTPFPGSKLYQRLKKANRVLTEYWGDYTLWNVVVKPNRMTVKELQEGFARVLTTVYSQESSTLRMEYFKNLYKQIRRKE